MKALHIVQLLVVFTSWHGADSFGHSLLPDFAFRQGYVCLNHGSYGSVPRVVTENMSKWSAQAEESPDAWFRSGLGVRNVFDFQDDARSRMASYIGGRFNDTVFVDNASGGVNAVLRSLARSMPAGQKILILNTAYFMVKMCLAYLEPGDTLLVNISLPGSDAEIIATVGAALAANAGSIYAASLSHIVSVPGMILPVAQLISLCHAHGVMVLVDGAHALGQVPVNVAALGADFWLGNGHKWLYSPKGSAVLWVRADRQSLIEPTTISWEGRGDSHFQLSFSYTGTTDMTRYLAMSAALDYRASIGSEAEIMEYMHELAVSGGRALAAAWETELLFDDTARFAAMVDVRVPTTNATLALSIGAALMQRYNTFVPIYDLSHVGGAVPNVFYARVSAQVYTELSDFEFLAAAVKEIISAGG